jgi:glycine cleavage system transcriptional repressor
MSTQAASRLVLTAVGPDRPGLVRSISQVVLAEKASVEDSRMAILGGEFALIMLVSGTEAAISQVERDARGLESELGLTFVVKRTRREPERQFSKYAIRVTGLDRPGIVHAVTDFLAKRKVNVASFESRLAFAPDTGTPLFVLEATLQVPAELTLGELERDLGALCQEENLDFSLDAKS